MGKNKGNAALKKIAAMNKNQQKAIHNQNMGAEKKRSR